VIAAPSTLDGDEATGLDRADRPPRILISCGEPSGDLYAAELVRDLLARVPEARVAGLGGPRLRDAGAHLIGDFAGLSVTGLSEAIRVLPRSLAMLRRLTTDARKRRPDVFVAVDFPDFNFRLMARMRRLGIPVVYYISPQLWAWRPTRMRTMQAMADRVLVIFPFEEALYRRADVDVRFVGHPLVDLARPSEPRETFLRGLGLDPARPVVALLPGSRPNELARLAQPLAGSVPLIHQQRPGVQFVVACAPGLDASLFWPFRAVAPLPVLVEGRADDVLAAADVVVTASGTATVQAALHERPMVVVYRLSAATYLVGKPFALVDMYAMPNLIAGRRIVPELIQGACTARRVTADTLRFLTDRHLYDTTRVALADVRRRLGASGASGRAAEAVLEMAHRSLGAGGPRV